MFLCVVREGTFAFYKILRKMLTDAFVKKGLDNIMVNVYKIITPFFFA